MTRWRVLLLLAAVGLCRACDVRNDLRDPAPKAYHADVVFTGTVRSRAPPRYGLYGVTFVVERVVKGELALRTVRLKYRNPGGRRDRRQRRLCVVDASLQNGARYIVFVKRAGGPLNLTALAAPEPHSRKAMRKVRRATCKRCVRTPRILPMKNVTVRLGGRRRLKCKARGAPPPDITWFKDGAPLRPSRRLRIKARRKKRRALSTLTIRRAAFSDAGVYECRARNMAGTASKRARVDVRSRGRPQGRPRDVVLPMKPCENDHVCMNGGRCILSLMVQEYSCECPDGFKGRRCEQSDPHIKHHNIVPPSETIAINWVLPERNRTKPRNRRRRLKRP